jgi:hypothetical protein
MIERKNKLAKEREKRNTQILLDQKKNNSPIGVRISPYFRLPRVT